MTCPTKPGLRFLRRWGCAFLATAGSLRLAVVLLAVCAGVLAWGTFVEKWHGAAAAHFAIYDAGWFTAIEVLLAVNVACAVLVRLPWRLRQSGFVVTHVGILVLLAGCLATKLGGIEAQLPIYEGKTANRAYQDSYHFELQVRPSAASAASERIEVPFVAGPFDWSEYAAMPWFPWQLPHRSQGVIYDADGIALEVSDFTGDPKPSAKVRLTVDGKTKELDLPAAIKARSDDDAAYALEGDGRTVTAGMRFDEVDLGFQLHLHRFARKLDPGTNMASHYSSLVDFLEDDQGAKGTVPFSLRENRDSPLRENRDSRPRWWAKTC